MTANNLAERFDDWLWVKSNVFVKDQKKANPF